MWNSLKTTLRHKILLVNTLMIIFLSYDIICDNIVTGMEGLKMTIGERIKNLRKQNNLLQEELGKKIGVARQTIASWESDRTLPNVEYTNRMASVFDCDITAITGTDMQHRLETHDSEEFLLLENYRKADPETRKMVMRILKYADIGD